MPASLYQPLFLAIMSVICVVMTFRYMSSAGYELQEKENGIWVPLIISIALVYWLGGRPISGTYFGDTASYAWVYNMDLTLRSANSEWVWTSILMICKLAKLDVHTYFTIIEAGYILSALWAAKRFFPTNPMLGMMFVLLSLSFFTFGVNGLRNGLACHLLLLAFSFLLDDKYLIGVIICIMAFGIHKSSFLPIAAFVAARYLISDVKYAVFFWLFCIPLSLLAGTTFEGFFASLGFDDRMTRYTSDTNDDVFKTGFRWDFLLYSFMPVLMGWYVCVKRNIEENWYRVLVNTYCFANAFWILVIRSSYSNRFAYLSWFLYPIIIAYPLINMPVWEEQDKVTVQILLCYGAFTVVMNVFYW